MAAFGKLVIMDKMRKCLFRPGARNLIDLVRERTDGHWNSNVLYVEEGQLVFPIEARRRYGGPRQPVKRYVVDDIFPGKSFGLPVEDAGDQLRAFAVVVQHPGR